MSTDLELADRTRVIHAVSLGASGVPKLTGEHQSARKRITNRQRRTLTVREDETAMFADGLLPRSF